MARSEEKLDHTNDKLDELKDMLISGAAPSELASQPLETQRRFWDQRRVDSISEMSTFLN